MLKHLITKPSNKQTILEIIDFVGDSPDLFAELMDCFINGSSRVSQTTSWALSHIGELEPIALHTLPCSPNYKTNYGADGRNIVLP